MENWDMKELDQTGMTGSSGRPYSLKILVSLPFILNPAVARGCRVQLL